MVRVADLSHSVCAGRGLQEEARGGAGIRTMQLFLLWKQW